MKKTRIYWGIVGALVASGIALSIVEKDGHYAFEWRGASLMAQTKADEYHDLASLQIFNRVLLQLQQNYVDPSLLDPGTMMPQALDNLQKYLPELLFIFDKPVKEHPTQVEARIGGAQEVFSLTDMSNLWEMSLRMRNILTFVQAHLPKDAKPQELEYELINGMLSALDPHSVILSPEFYRSMVEGNRGKFGGLGIVVRMIDGVLIVVEPVDGDVPAKRAGIQEGDQILTIDGTPTLNMNISEAVDLLKGEPNTTVKLSVMRKGWKQAKEIDVVRAEINIPSLESAALSDQTAYIKLKSFQGNSQSEMLKALDKLSKEMGGISSLILDLRGNPGGLLDQAVMIADNFIDKGTIVTTVGVNDTLQQPRTATSAKTQPAYPIAVLMDSSSASASEIVAGALKNNNRAMIIGDTSFGKGSVQVLYELPDKSALKLTIGQYLTPGNLSIQSVGIVPDIKLVPMLAGDGDINLYPKPWVRREAGLGGHLVNQKAATDQKSAYSLRYLSQRYALPEEDIDDDSVITLEDVDKLIKSKPKNKKPGDDPQVRLAQQILKRIGAVNERHAMVENFVAHADALQREEDDVLIDALKKRDIDWTNGAQPENIQLETTLTTDKATNRVAAGDTYTLHASVTNKGEAPVYRVAGLTESTFGRANDKEFIFGRIDPGQTVTRSLSVKTNRANASRVDKIDLNVYTDTGAPTLSGALSSAALEMEINAIAQPDFSIHYAIIDKDGNSQNVGNGLLDDNEQVTVRLWVSNDGSGTAEKPLIFLKNPKNQEIKLLDARAETEPLKTSERVQRDFTFQTASVSAADVTLELHVYDKASTRMLVEKVAFKTSKGGGEKNHTVTKIEGNKWLSAEAPLYVSPLPDANTLISLPRGAVVAADAAFGNFIHVTAGDTMGWVAADSLSDAPQSQLTTIEPATIATIPRIRVASLPHVTAQDAVTIDADVSGFAELTDFYVYAAYEVDHEYDYHKVDYEPLSSKNAHIQTTVPLKPGQNTIRLYVRDANKSEARESILVYKR